MDSSDNQNSNYSDRIHELRDDNPDLGTNERFIINLIKESMEKDKLRDKECLETLQDQISYLRKEIELLCNMQ